MSIILVGIFYSFYAINLVIKAKRERNYSVPLKLYSEYACGFENDYLSFSVLYFTVHDKLYCI